MTVNTEVVEVGGVDDGESRAEEDAEKIVLFEARVLPLRVRCFPFRHAFVAFKDDTGEHSDDDAFVAEFAEEAAVAIVDGARYCSEVADVVVEGVSVDMVDGFSRFNLTFEGEVLKACEEHIACPTWQRQIPRFDPYTAFLFRQLIQCEFLSVLIKHVVCFGVQPDDLAFGVTRVGLFVAA